MEFLSNNFISEFFVWCLNGLDSLFLNYAAAIITLTIIIRLALLPIDLYQRRNQSRMAALGPELQSLQKRYKNNPQQIQRKQRELYRKMNVRPMFGCVQSLIQLPIWFAFFGAMRVLASEQTVGMILDAAQNGASTIDLPNFFWVKNFWQPDNGLSGILPTAEEFLGFVQSYSSYISPQALALLQDHDILSFANDTMWIAGDGATYNALKQGIIEANGVQYVLGQNGVMQPEFNNGWFILPAMAGVSLFLQQKFAPAASNAAAATPMMAGADPNAAATTQQTSKMMMYFMPIFSVIICLTSNAAFALYWTVSSLYAFAQMRVVGLIKNVREKKKVKEIVIE